MLGIPDDSLLCKYCNVKFKNKYIRKTHETNKVCVTNNVTLVDIE